MGKLRLSVAQNIRTRILYITCCMQELQTNSSLVTSFAEPKRPNRSMVGLVEAIPHLQSVQHQQAEHIPPVAEAKVYITILVTLCLPFPSSFFLDLVLLRFLKQQCKTIFAMFRYSHLLLLRMPHIF